jgi:RNA polymerase sigma-32 factor
MGLVHASRLYDPARGSTFSTIAYIWMKAYVTTAIVRNYRLGRYGSPQRTSLVVHRVNRWLRSNPENTTAALNAFLGENKGVSEFSQDEMERVIAYAKIPELYLDGASSHDHLSPNETFLETYADPFEDLNMETLPDLQKWERTIQAWYVEATPQERVLFDERLAADEPKTLQQIGDAYGVSGERIRQIEARIRRELAVRAKKAGVLNR